jgi:hypothetical protein
VPRGRCPLTVYRTAAPYPSTRSHGQAVRWRAAAATAASASTERAAVTSASPARPRHGPAPHSIYSVSAAAEATRRRDLPSCYVQAAADLGREHLDRHTLARCQPAAGQPEDAFTTCREIGDRSGQVYATAVSTAKSRLPDRTPRP